MILLAQAPWIIYFLLGLALFCTSTFLILLVLVQKGRGGGLTGALGGMGGQSAFGTKAGDVFTRITIVTAIIWIVLCIVSLWTLQEPPARGGGGGNSTASQDDDSGDDGGN